MTRTFKNVVGVLCLLALFLVAAFAVAGCAKDDDPGGEENTPALELSASSLTLDLYETGTITATVTNSDEQVTFSLDKEDVVTLTANGSTATLTPKKEGEVTLTAKAGDLSQTAAVKVEDSGNRPGIVLANDSATLVGGQTYPLNVTAKYKGAELDGVQFSYESSDTAVVTVDDTGVLTAGAYVKDANTATITVSGSYLGFNMVPETFEVTVTEDVTINAPESVQLYTSDPLGTGLSLEEAIEISVYKDGNEVTEPQLTIASGDDTVAKYENGKIVAVGAGDTKVTVKYTSTSGEEYTVEIAVEVTKTALQFEEKTIDLDLSASTNTLDLSAVGMGQLPQGSLDSAKVTIGGVEVSASVSDATLTFTSLQGVASRENAEIVLETDKLTVKGTVNVAKAIIHNADDFSIKFLNANNPGEGELVLLAANIDCTGRAVTTDRRTGGNFAGIFDGRGYTVANLEVTNQNGLLGAGTKTGVLKNVAFVNALVQNDNKCGGYLASNGNGMTLENVYWQGVSTVDDRAAETPARNTDHGLLFNYTDDPAGTVPLNLKNIVIIAEYTGEYGSGNVGILHNSKIGTVENVYNVSSIDQMCRLTPSDAGNSYATVAELKTGVASALSAFKTEDGWDTSWGFPIMESAMEYDASVLTAMQEQFEDKEYDQAEETTVTLPSSVAYSIELSGDGAKYIDDEAFAEGKLVIEGLTAGTSESVTITITSLLSGKSESATFKVKCAKEVVDFTFVGDLDRSANSQKLDFGSDEDFTDAELANATVTIGDVSVTATGSGTELTFGDLSACAVGEAVDITIETSTAIFKGKINVATAFIKDFDTFMLLRTNHWASRSASDDSKYRDGYYIVTEDIDLSKTAEVASYEDNKDTLSASNKGFNITGYDAYGTLNSWHGVLDGRGHYLYNLSVGGRGMFGSIDDTSVIKNIGFSITRTVNAWWGALAIESRGIIDNCYLVVNSLNAGNHNGSFVGTLGGSGKITNSISVVKEACNSLTGFTRHGLIVGCVTSASAVLQNVYTINSGTAAAVDVQSNGSASVLDTANSVYGKFASIAALVTAVEGQTGVDGTANLASFDGFNSKYWTVSDTGIVWKTAEAQSAA
mgnify:CR=1 FL=1